MSNDQIAGIDRPATAAEIAAAKTGANFRDYLHSNMPTGDTLFEEEDGRIVRYADGSVALLRSEGESEAWDSAGDMPAYLYDLIREAL